MLVRETTFLLGSRIRPVRTVVFADDQLVYKGF
jgi:hypothetical protein